VNDYVPASDLYSLGATIIYLLTGRHPAELPQVDLKIQFEAVTNVSSDLKNWITQATHPFLDRRFPNAEAALEELKNPVRSELSSSPPFGTPITCHRSDEGLRIQQPISDRHYARAIVLQEIFNRLTVWSIILTILLLIMTIFGLFLGAMLGATMLAWGLIGGFLMGCILSIFCIQAWNQNHPIVFSRLIHQEYRITETDIHQYQWLLFRKRPDLNTINRSHFKQIDRIPAHKAGYESNTQNGTVIRWTDVPGRIELRADGMTFKLDNLSEPELDWLCTELSDYLELPVVRHSIGD
jgi:serine/threonine protein kinase